MGKEKELIIPEFVGGIPQWFFDPSQGEYTDYQFPGALSHRLLNLYRDMGSLYITDAKQIDRCRLQANIVSNDFINFDVRTTGHNRIPFLRHPDMYAREFCLAAHHFFSRQGYQISGIETHWYRGSTNFNQFERVFRRHLEQGYDTVQAAIEGCAGTWTFQNVAGALGYTRIILDDIDLDGDNAKISTFMVRP